ncbi:hypothetical protein [Streptomyces sp. NPDC058572]|uniref:hypothetical protein n=1 Tax=Streptomyces sp. NPDC058572 TaxID=3346546 RepID=UPI00364CD977
MAPTAVPHPEADGGWRELPVQRLTFAAPELVSDPKGFGDSLVAWHNPSLQRRLGHAVSADAPAGVVDGVLESRPRPVSVQRWEPSAAGEMPPHGRPVGQATGGEAVAATRQVESDRPIPSVDEAHPGTVTEAVAPVTPLAPVVVPLAPQQSLTVARAVEPVLRTLPVRPLPAVATLTASREAVPVQRLEGEPQPDPGPEAAAASADPEQPLVEQPLVGERPVFQAGPADALAPVAPVAVQRAQDVVPPGGEERSSTAEHPVLPVIAPAPPGAPGNGQHRDVSHVPERPSVEPERAPAPVQHVQRVADDPLGHPRREERPSMPSPPKDPLDPPDARPDPRPELQMVEKAAADPVAETETEERPLVGEQPMTSVGARPPAVPEAPEPSVPPAPAPLSPHLPMERHVRHEGPAAQRLREENPATVAEPPAERPLVGEHPLSPAGAPSPGMPEHAPAPRVGLGGPLPSVPGTAPVQRQELQPPVPPGAAPAPRRLGLGAPLPAVPVLESAPAPESVSAHASAPPPALESAVPVSAPPEALPAAAQEPTAVPVPVQRQEEPLTVVRATPLQRTAKEMPLVPEPRQESVAGLVGERGIELKSAPLPARVPAPDTEAPSPEPPPVPPAAVPVTWIPSTASPASVQRSVRGEPTAPRRDEAVAAPPVALPSAAVPSWAPPPVAAPPIQRSTAPGSPASVPWEPVPVPASAPRVAVAEPPSEPAVPVSWAPAPAPVQRAPEPAPAPPPEPASASEPPPPSQQLPAQAGQPAAAAAAPGGGESTDELVRRLVGPLSRLLRAELRLDRERAGVRLDPRH